MTKIFGRKKHKQNNVFYTVITVILLCAVFLSMVAFFYVQAEDEAYEMLHIQTKQIKDDIQLQMISDRENLATMANFAAKLYKDGEDYSLLFESFKPIGLIENIGILDSNNVFHTKAGNMDLNEKISFYEEAEKGAYISGRIKDLTIADYEIIRSAVPVRVDDETVGVLYGVIKLDAIKSRYNSMAEELEAQLFIYETESGDLVVDTVHDELGNISFLKDRVYNKGYSYEKMMETDKGFTSFVSAYTGEDLYMHYSALEKLGWEICVARYESQVFAATRIETRILLTAFLIMVIIMALYMLIITRNERRVSAVTKCASEVRRILLEVNQQENNIGDALKQVCLFSKARSAVFIDTDGADYNYVMPALEEKALNQAERNYFMGELFRYAMDLRKITRATVGVMCIKANDHLNKTKPDFYNFLNEHKIKEVSFAAVTNNENHITILAALNPAKSKESRLLAEKVAVCFSIALFNKKHLNRTEMEVITDSLTGALNRVAYKKDIQDFNAEKPDNFSCIYIDVNELHLRNNKYGHAAGDEMLVYIANTLKEIFYGHRIYRMGGDEFLVFTKELDPDAVREGIETLIEQLRLKDYKVAIGMSYRMKNADAEEMVREAEVRMYEAKAQYYQNKGQKSVFEAEDLGYVQVKTGIAEIDTMISVLREHYNGIYRVSMNTDKARRILMPKYLEYNEEEESFSNIFTRYIDEIVDPDFHRPMISFLNYDAIKRHLSEGSIPRITYKKNNGEAVILSVYRLNDDSDDIRDTLWVFAKD